MGRILTICNSLRAHFSSTANSSKVQRPLLYSSIEKEDVRVFAWIGKLIGKDISSYSMYADTPNPWLIELTLQLMCFIDYMMGIFSAKWSTWSKRERSARRQVCQANVHVIVNDIV